MIILKDLTHIYHSKKGARVVAIDKVNYSFNNSGLYFITGKSGCGKSTLLNLLSGIDKVKEGKIIVDGEDMTDFSESDYDNYRNNYAGIIFQEFNLIETMTVYENLDMPLRLQGKNDNKEIIAECLRKVGLEGYEDRYPSELSGGQRQRITIARQLAKGSKLIIADEPTGSLDSENGTKVFEMLKKLSKDMLIIVASHDIEFCEKYGDVIIRMVDGKIVEESILCPSKNDNSCNYIEKKKSKFPSSYAFKMGFSDILHSKIRFIISTLLCITSLVLLGIFISFNFYSSEEAFSKTLIARNDEYYTMVSGLGPDDNQFSPHSNLSQPEPLLYKQLNSVESLYSKEQYVKKISGCMFTVNNILCNSGFSIYESEDDLLCYDFHLAAGALPLSSDNVYITDYFAYGIIKSGLMYESGISYANFQPTDSIYSLVGKTVIDSSDSYIPIRLKVAGIINTDYMKYITLIDEFFETGKISSQNLEKHPDFYYYVEQIYSTFFVTKEFAASIQQSVPLDGEFYKIRLNGCDIHVESLWNNMGSFYLYRDEVLLTSHSYIENPNDFKLEEGQVILSLAAYNEIFNENNKENYYYNNFGIDIHVKNHPTHIGEKIKLDFYDEYNDKVVYDIPELEVVGVCCYDDFRIHSITNTNEDKIYSDVFVSNETFNNVATNALSYSFITIKTDANASVMENSLKNLRDKYMCFYNYYSNSIYKFELSYQNFEYTFLVFSFVLLFFSIIMFANFTGATISKRKKDIGIIRAVGGTKNNIFKIFLMEGIIFAVITSIFAIIVSFVSNIFINNSLNKDIISDCKLLSFSLYNLLIIPGICLIAMLLATYFPIRKMNKKAPAEVIRNN